jgi:hypothetical protein
MTQKQPLVKRVNEFANGQQTALDKREEVLA